MSTEIGNRWEPKQNRRNAFCLGWATAELFGRLRTYRPPGRRHSQPRTLARFSYSTHDVSDTQRLAVAYRQLVELATALSLPSPNLPRLVGLLNTSSSFAVDDDELKQIHNVLEEWSQQAFVELSARSQALGRAMTYGGSLADTYWAMAEPDEPAFYSGRRSAKELLRSYRIQDLQKRMYEMADLWEAGVREAITDSLQAWTWDDAKAAWIGAADENQASGQGKAKHLQSRAERLQFNLARQAEIWRELIFGARQPIDYVGEAERRRAAWSATMITTAIILLVAFGVAVLAFILSRWILNEVWSPDISSQLERRLIEALSALVSMISAVATAAASLSARASSLIKRHTAWLQTTLLWRVIRRKTTVPWNKRS